MNSLKIESLQFTETYMLLMKCSYIRGEEIPQYSKNSTWNLWHTYKNTHSKISIDECTGYGLKSYLNISTPMCKHEIF